MVKWATRISWSISRIYGSGKKNLTLKSRQTIASTLYAVMNMEWLPKKSKKNSTKNFEKISRFLYNCYKIIFILFIHSLYQTFCRTSCLLVYPSLHPFGVVHWVPVLSNIKTATGCESNRQLQLWTVFAGTVVYKYQFNGIQGWAGQLCQIRCRAVI